VKIATRKAFNTEETAAYAADLNAQMEAHGILDTARTATHLRGELHEELRA
jgi:hypothetical protein